MNLIPFPGNTITLQIAVTTGASTSIALPATGNSLRVVNDGSNTAFFSVGTGSQTATVPATSNPVNNCTVIMAGEDVMFTIPRDEFKPSGGVHVTYNISAITSTGTATLYVSVGEGV